MIKDVMEHKAIWLNIQTILTDVFGFTEDDAKKKATDILHNNPQLKFIKDIERKTLCFENTPDGYTSVESYLNEGWTIWSDITVSDVRTVELERYIYYEV